LSHEEGIPEDKQGHDTEIHHEPRGRRRQRPRDHIPIVGIGASAGGLEALEQFLGHVPAECGMAFVVVQHQDPSHKGVMTELLQRSTPMKVSLVKDRTKVEPGCVYVIPSNRDMSILHGTLHLFEPTSPRGLRLPIDFFLRSLAKDQGERSVGMILSGMGTDGTLGLTAIKEAGGVVLVQTPVTAKFDGMPRSAIETGLADVVAPADELGGKLVAYFQHAGRVLRAEPLQEIKAQSALDKIVILLRAQTGNDFSLYKKSTLYRRIERRMGLLQMDKIARYTRYLQDNLQEREMLFNELLIGVTSFFRDPAAWTQLKERALPALLAKRPEGGQLRAWVAGCSTGEEAYSLAIIFKEALELAKPKANFTLQIFATDLDRAAIDKARAAVYPANIAADVPAPRLRRFFVKEENGRFHVAKEIREMVTFAPQNVIMDPPFTRLDLLVCRNLLIYLAPELQKKLLPLFHYTLNPGGVLFLGAAESVGAFADHFDAFEGKWRLYRRKELPLRVEPVDFPSTFVSAQAKQAVKAGVVQPAPDLHALTDQVILQRFGPACVLATSKGDILYISGRTGKYLEPATGKANWNIFVMAREGMRYELHAACQKALRQEGPVVVNGLRVRTNSHEEAVDLTVQMLDDPEPLRGMLMVVFRAVPAVSERRVRAAAGGEGRGEAAAREREIQNLRSQLQTLREEMQTSQEELKSSNEELQSTNEELQSTNEELTTSKEEMQSLNEELQTVNAELQAKVDELSRANNDMKNLLNSTDIATLFLDNALHIRRFTTQATRVIKLIPTDVGRPVTDITSDLAYPELADDVNEVLRTLVSVDKQVPTRDGRWFGTRIMPYRTLEDRIDGVVITFSEITAFKKLEADLRQAHGDTTARERERTLELEDMLRLQKLGVQLWKEPELEPLLRQVLEASMTLLRADKGNVQLYDESQGTLTIAVASGFNQEFLDHFKTVTVESGSVCAAAIERRARVLVADLPADANFPELRPIAAAHGYAAVQSTPLFAHDGKLQGMLSTHWAKPHQPTERELRLLDLYAQLAERAIERLRAVQDLRQSREETRAGASLDEVRRGLSAILRRTEGNQELKRQVNELLKRLGEPQRYPTTAGGKT
jgi:two-component system CheB/CheR fusion protein